MNSRHWITLYIGDDTDDPGTWRLAAFFPQTDRFLAVAEDHAQELYAQHPAHVVIMCRPDHLHTVWQ